MEKDIKFPEGFFWGSATSSYQVEGGINDNDWAQAAKEGLVPDTGRACDHFNRYKEDFDIAKSLGQNAHRFSLEWARIEPEEGKFDESAIKHYRNVITELKSHNIEPFVTLWHFTLPHWFDKKGGFTNSNAPEIFSRYCAYAVKKLGKDVKFWITINEPIIYAKNGYVKGNWPPFRHNLVAAIGVINHLVESHNLVYQEMKRINREFQIGIAKNNMDFDSAKFSVLGRAIQSVGNFFWNHYLLRRISKHQDFIGLNFYFHKYFGYKFYEQKSDLGWPVYPPAIYHVLKELKKYRKPIYVTENGIADSADKKRGRYIKEYLEWVHRAMEDGIDVRGYFYWSLLDNFEWAHGFGPRFGLVEINYQTLGRRIRPSAYFYRDVCLENGITSGIIEKHKSVLADR